MSVRPAQHDEEHALRATRDEAGQDIRRTAGSGFILCQQYDLLGQVTRQRAGREPVHFTAEEMRE